MKLAYPTSADLPSLLAWAKRLIEDLNKIPSFDDLPTASDDADASAKNIRIGSAYKSPDGLIRWRAA